jgi:hypothetical protein
MPSIRVRQRVHPRGRTGTIPRAILPTAYFLGADLLLLGGRAEASETTTVSALTRLSAAGTEGSTTVAGRDGTAAAAYATGSPAGPSLGVASPSVSPACGVVLSASSRSASGPQRYHATCFDGQERTAGGADEGPDVPFAQPGTDPPLAEDAGAADEPLRGVAERPPRVVPGRQHAGEASCQGMSMGSTAQSRPAFLSCGTCRRPRPVAPARRPPRSRPRIGQGFAVAVRAVAAAFAAVFGLLVAVEDGFLWPLLWKADPGWGAYLLVPAGLAAGALTGAVLRGGGPGQWLSGSALLAAFCLLPLRGRAGAGPAAVSTAAARSCRWPPPSEPAPPRVRGGPALRRGRGSGIPCSGADDPVIPPD